MTMDSDILSPQDQEKLELQLTDVFETVISVSEEMREAKELGESAKEKAQSVKVGFFRGKNEAVKRLKDATITTADTTLATLEVVDKVSENQQKMVEACNQFIKLGAVDIANNRAVIAFIEKTISDGADKTIGEETIAQLRGVIHDLKQKEDLLVRQKKQGEKINEHDTRLLKIEAREKEIDNEIDKARSIGKLHDDAIKLQRKEGIERDKRLDFGDERDKIQDEKIKELHEKNAEQDERLQQGVDYDLKQDKRLDQGEAKDITQDEAIENQLHKDQEHDLALNELKARIKKLEDEVAVTVTKDRKKNMFYIAISTGIGLIGVILGVIALIV